MGVGDGDAIRVRDLRHNRFDVVARPLGNVGEDRAGLDDNLGTEQTISAGGATWDSGFPRTRDGVTQHTPTYTAYKDVTDKYCGSGRRRNHW